MAYQESRQHAASASSSKFHPIALGLEFFAAVLLMLIGGFHAIAGLAAILDDQFYVVRPNFALEIDVTTWGWVHLIAGTLLVFNGLAVVAGSKAARVVTIVIVGLSVLLNFYSIPYYPVWSILMIALGVVVIWALLAHQDQVNGR